jgi:hypothetical protein
LGGVGKACIVLGGTGLSGERKKKKKKKNIKDKPEM